MADRDVRLITKRTSVSGKIPTGTTGTELNFIKQGELASNLSDKKLFSYDGSNVFEFGSSSFFSLTGGTISGNTIIQGSLTVTGNSIITTAITNLDYLIFNTGTTSASTIAGTVFFDNNEKALSYNTSLNQAVTVNLGQQNYIRVFNNSGVDIQRGKALEILTAYSGLPAVTLAINRQVGFNIIGVSTEIIPNNSEGIAITNGIISNIQLTGMSIGSLIYASDTTPGELEEASKYINFPLTARTNEIGYVVQTGLTTGKLFVAINNENAVLSLTDLQRNVLEGNVISTGVFAFSGISLSSSTTFNVGPIKAWVVDNTTDYLKPSVQYIQYSGQTNLTTPYLNTDTETYILLTTASTITLQNTFPTPQQRRVSVYLGKLGHGNKTSLINAFNEPDLDVSPISQLRDMFSPIKLINEGVLASPNGANLQFNTSAGNLWGLGIGFVQNQLNPSSIYVSGNTSTTFQYRTQTGGTATNTTNVIPGSYDLGGAITAIGLPAKQSTNQRVYLLQNGQIRLQYGQTVYIDLTTAVSSLQSEVFTTFSNFKDNAILIGILSLRSDTTNLSDSEQARFIPTSKFGELLGGTLGLSTTTLQQAYNNSTSPEIITNSTLGGFQFRAGTGSDLDANIIIENNAGAQTGAWYANGNLVANNLTATTLSATTISGGTLYSGSTNLYDIFEPINKSPYRTFVLTAGTSFNFTGTVNTVSVNKTTGSATQVNLSSNPSINDFFVVKDRKGDSNLNPITVSGGTNTIDGSTSYIIKIKNKPSLTFLFDGSEYIVI